MFCFSPPAPTCRMTNKIDTWYVMVRECHTNADWRRAEYLAKATTDSVQNKNLINQ